MIRLSFIKNEIKKWGCYEKGRIILVLALTLILVTLSGCFYKDYCNDVKDLDSVLVLK